MNGGNVPITLYYTQLLELPIFILHPILREGFLHVKGATKSLPAVAASMFVVLFVPGEDLVYGFLAGHFQQSCMVSYHIYQLYCSAFFCQFPDDVLHILPPLYLVLLPQVQILSSRAVVFCCSGLSVNFHPWLPTCRVKPVSYIIPCCLDKSLCLFLCP